MIYHTMQREISHSRPVDGCGMFPTMKETESETFIRNLIAAVDASDYWTDARLSKAAGVNRRAVTDMREGRVKSPKLSTVFKLAKALNRDPGEMMGIGPRERVRADLAEFLSQYSEDEQEKLLSALNLFPRHSA